MKRNIRNLVIILFAVFFTIIFYKQAIGLNLFLFNIALLVLLSWVKAFDFKNKTHAVLICGVFLTAVGTLMHASALVITMNIFSLVLLIGLVNNGRLRVLGNIVISGFYQFFVGYALFFNRDKHSEKKNGRIKVVLRWIGLALIPVIVFIVFFLLYSASSSKFSSIFGFIGVYLNDFFKLVFSHLNYTLILLFCFGFVVACAYFVKTQTVTAFHEPQSDSLQHTKKYKYHGKNLGLLSEYRIGIIMFSLLNILLLIFNAVDIWHVWFHFEWNGELLKEFVHEGTYVLIFTLMISVGLVLIFFRKNLNFFSKNKSLKILADIWLGQNIIMAISVLIRNLYYINYYNLAYLRIGVLLFLAMVFFGLITVLIKINGAKNFFYLLRVNMLFIYLSLMIFSLADWDVIIARFNFSRVEKAFVPLDFMARLDDKALPYLDRAEAELEQLERNPVFMKLGKKGYFMESSDYLRTLEQRKSEFIEAYPKRSFLEWNYANHKAYKILTEKVGKE